MTAALRAFAVLGLISLSTTALAQGGPPLQGQVPLADQLSGRSLQNYKQNVNVVGHHDILRRGMNGNLGWLDDCAYVSTYYGGTDPLEGLAVLDVSSPHNPILVNIFPGTPGTRESQVEANADSRMMVVMPFSSSTIFGDPPGPTQLQIYDVPGDCRFPVRVGTYEFDYVTHEHRIWRHIIYATQNSPSRAVSPEKPPALSVIDATDKSNPVLLTTWNLSDEPGMPRAAIHDLDISPDGRRAYINLRSQDPPDGIGQGVMILDTSEIADGVRRPKIRRISRLEVQRPPDTFTNTHSAQLVTIAGRPYVLAMDETFTTARCPWGWARIVDVSDEESPIQVSTFRLEANQRRHCDTTLQDNAMYSSHYLGVDDPDDAKLAFFTWYSSGLRIVDISDPYAPKEVGYFIPGATTDTVFVDNRATRFGNTFVDYAYSFVRYHNGNIWFNSVYGGFWVVKYTGK
jgi:hypothetical protein